MRDLAHLPSPGEEGAQGIESTIDTSGPMVSLLDEMLAKRGQIRRAELIEGSRRAMNLSDPRNQEGQIMKINPDGALGAIRQPEMPSEGLSQAFHVGRSYYTHKKSRLSKAFFDV